MDLFDFPLVFGEFDYNLIFQNQRRLNIFFSPSKGTQVHVGLSKADRLVYGDCAMNHAMLLTGCHIEDDMPKKWRIENSWGEDSGVKGYITMTNEWFNEFVFEIVVDRSHCSDEILEAFKSTPVILPAWDPMGSLAKCNCEDEI